MQFEQQRLDRVGVDVPGVVELVDPEPQRLHRQHDLFVSAVGDLHLVRLVGVMVVAALRVRTLLSRLFVVDRPLHLGHPVRTSLRNVVYSASAVSNFLFISLVCAACSSPCSADSMVVL